MLNLSGRKISSLRIILFVIVLLAVSIKAFLIDVLILILEAVRGTISADYYGVGD
jgi:hypothetical protein